MVSEVKLTLRDSIGRDELECEAKNLHALLENPTIFDLSNGYPASFISVLLHGNEVTGWDAIRRYISTQDMSKPCNSMVLYVGNVEAAATNQRLLAQQMDFNRIWCGGNRPEHEHAEKVVGYLREIKPRFALDIHNNSGLNPHYSVITHATIDCLFHARKFSDIALLAPKPHSVITRRLNELCPSITIEVGLSGEQDSLDRTLEYLDYVANNDASTIERPNDLSVFRTIASMQIESSGSANFCTFPDLNADLQRLNFSLVPAGTYLTKTLNDDWTIKVYDNDDNDETQRYLDVNHSQVRFQQSVFMAMFTLNKQNAYQDCVCYFLEATSTPHA